MSEGKADKVLEAKSSRGAHNLVSLLKSLGDARHVFAGLYELLYGRRRVFVALLLSITVVASLESFAVVLVLPMIAALQGEPVPLQDWLDVLPGFQSNPVVAVGLLVAATFIVKNSLSVVYLWWSAGFFQTIWERWIQRIVDNLLYSSVERHSSVEPGRVVASAFTETTLSLSCLHRALELTGSLLTFCSIYLLLLLISWPATLIMTVVLGLFAGLALRPLARSAHAAGAQAIKSGRLILGKVLDIVGGLYYVKAYGRETSFRNDVHETLARVRDAQLTRHRSSRMVQPFVEMLMALLLVAAILTVSFLFGSDVARRLPVIGVFVAAAYRLYPVLSGLGGQWVDIIGKQAAVAATVEAVKPRPKETTGTTPIRRLQREIVLDNVCYKYSGRPPALDGVSAVLGRGKRTALVGESGSGKSTIVSLLLGFLRPTAGTILVDGSPLEELDLESWRRRLGYVGQDAFLFNTTIARNITLDRLPFDDHRVVDAAVAVGLDEFLRTLPDGYETLVGDRGVQMSGGQRQRIALARAIVLKPEILLLDEAVNALDNESATRLMTALKSFLPGVTIITVSHRLVATANYDSILVLREGRLVESGKHSDLVQQGGYYSELFELEQMAPVHLDSQ